MKNESVGSLTFNFCLSLLILSFSIDLHLPAMLLNRSSRAVTSKQSNLMTDHHTSSSQSSSSPIQNYTTKPLQSFFGFKSDVPLISPTSILEPFSPNKKNPFSKQKIPDNKWVKLDSEGIGVALIGDDDEKTSSTKLVLFGTKLLNLQFPNPPSPAKFTADFGIKTRNSQFSKSGDNSQISTDDQVLIKGCVSMSELEMSEDYTCVISYDGLNPKTTHIYDNFVLENCSSLSTDKSLKEKSFLSFCHTCEKKLEHKNDIFIYRGDEAFCSQECRHRKMVLDGTES